MPLYIDVRLARGSMYIYLDESGDLGFDFSKRKTTEKFVITLLVCDTHGPPRQFRKAVRRTLKNKIHRKKGVRLKSELKGANTSLQVKKYFLRLIQQESDWGIYTVVLNKKRVQDHLRRKMAKSKLYNFLARFAIEKLSLKTTSTNVRLIVDRSKNRAEIRDFNRYIQNQIEALLPLNTRLIIEHLSSFESAGLQAADLFSWGVFRKYEFADKEWYDVFSSQIRFETEYLQKKRQ
jgi:hypothetical protein